MVIGEIFLCSNMRPLNLQASWLTLLYKNCSFTLCISYLKEKLHMSEPPVSTAWFVAWHTSISNVKGGRHLQRLQKWTRKRTLVNPTEKSQAVWDRFICLFDCLRNIQTGLKDLVLTELQISTCLVDLTMVALLSFIDASSEEAQDGSSLFMNTRVLGTWDHVWPSAGFTPNWPFVSKTTLLVTWEWKRWPRC